MYMYPVNAVKSLDADQHYDGKSNNGDIEMKQIYQWKCLTLLDGIPGRASKQGKYCEQKQCDYGM